jgi:hypothetical protein
MNKNSSALISHCPALAQGGFNNRPTLTGVFSLLELPAALTGGGVFFKVMK